MALATATTSRDSLIVVANRLPVHRVRGGSVGEWETSPGGLVTALYPLLRERGGWWVGWSGSAGGDARVFEHEGISLRPVPLSRGELEHFYEGFSNETLWPLYHDALRTAQFHRDWWRTYVEINSRFAEAVCSLAAPGSAVWVHDYHLQLVPGMLRSSRPDLRIGFFLHIPFPPIELFGRLPWRREILEGLLGADVVGFQTRLMAQNFLRAARAYTRARGAGSVLHFGGRSLRVLPFPISIDVDEFGRIAAEPGTLARAAGLRRRIGENRKIILGVDRLDYTKGIDVRLRAFEEVLRRGDLTTRGACMVQVAVPSRGGVDEYAAMRRLVEQTVGHINGEYGEPGRVAVHYLHRNLSRDDLIVYYRAADVMMVTPLRDGMNLVAKEYVASRPDETGVLVLSEFAGAASELRQAVGVNPFDVDGMAGALVRACSMPEREQRHRMRAMRRRVRAYDLYAWAESFLGVLAEDPPG
ncbi:MAG: trehalose-6-phosphate synthase [Phycisphaerales bacterium]|nr:trehalose-6-phosphate synthase [Phycisphaerales bacterium]